MSSSIGSLGEHALIARLRGHVRTPAPFVLVGIGDDAAVLQPERGEADVLTTDALVEGVHFRREWTAPDAIGHKALAVNLSDLAAMGARPRAALLSLVLPDALPLEAFDQMLAGFLALADRAGSPLVGGNITRSPGPMVIDVTAIGTARPRRVLTRGGARAGHDLYVTGTIGGAAAGLAMLAAGMERGQLDADSTESIRRYERPDARWRCGASVARSGTAAAAIDLSDGLADGATQLARAAGLGVVIDGSTLPIDPGAVRWAGQRSEDAVALALAGGDDYELAFSVSPRQRRRFLAAVGRFRDLPITCVGRFVDEAGSWVERDGRRDPLGTGFEHFA